MIKLCGSFKAHFAWSFLILCPLLLVACGGGGGGANAGGTGAETGGAIGIVPSTGGGSGTGTGTNTGGSDNSHAPTSPASDISSSSNWGAPTKTLDRIDFGNIKSEKLHNFKDSYPGQSLAAIGELNQSFRQTRLIVYGTADSDNKNKVIFDIIVDPLKQNYLTVKLFGSDTQFGVLHLSNSVGDVEIDNNAANSAPFFGRFHFATVAIPIVWTNSKSLISISLYSSGFFYDSGAGIADKLTRPVYSAYTHIDPFFVPPSTDQTGVAPPLVSSLKATALTKQDAFAYMRGMRGDIFDINNRQGGWHPGGWLKQMGGCSYDAPRPGLPPELVGLSVQCPADQALIDQMAKKPNAADAWRNALASWGIGAQIGPMNVNTAVYMLPPFVNENGNVEPGYDRYHDPALLRKIVGLLDGLARMQGRGGSWDTGCNSNSDSSWAGISSTTRAVGQWAGSKERQDAGCISFEGGDAQNIGRTILRLLNEDAFVASAFKSYLDQAVDADFNGIMVKRAYMYQRMLGKSRFVMGFDPIKASTSNDFFDKAGITAVQALIFQQHAYSGQLAMRQLIALFPGSNISSDAPLDAALQRSIVRQLIGLERPTVLNHAPPGTEWRLITRAGISETYGTLSSGYDGRYGGGIPAAVSNIVSLSKYDTSLSAADREEFGEVGRRTVAAFVSFFYPQLGIGSSTTGPIARQTFAQDDVISYRVPYGPNVNGATSNWPTFIRAADPEGSVRSPLALRALLFGTQSGLGQDPSGVVDNLATYSILESSWRALAGVDPSTLQAMPAEPGQPDFMWADIESGAVSMQWKGERLLLNANYRRPKGEVNNSVRIHHITDMIDREASVMMPFDATTVQSDGNLSGDVNHAWVVRYGRYLVVLNRGTSDYTVRLPAGSGKAYALQRKGSVPMGSSATISSGAYEAFVFP